MHKSIKLNTPCEFINITPLNPLISKCQIKVCYVGEDANRNGSIITKEVATEMANSLPGSPIVGFYNEAKEDFEGHNRIIEIAGGELKFKDTTRPYGFVDLGAKAWFQKFLDDDAFEREYLMTEGYLWTGQYPECQRIIDNGNNQSMELDEETLKASWSKDINGDRQFFIINEAVISKLCILGEDTEPCFEGASISQVQFSFEEDFKSQLFSMMNELKDLIKGGTDNVIAEENKTEVIEETATSETEVEQVEETANETEVVIEENAESISDEETDFAKKDEEEDADDKDEEVCPECGKPVDECECDKEDDKEEKKNYSLEEIPEYVELSEKYESLATSYSNLETEVNALREFKASVEKKEKEAMISSFYMLSDEDKKDVMDNIDTYSLEDIEAKLSIICVRNKVSFALEEEEDTKKEETVELYNVNNGELEDDNTPAWVKAAISTAKSM